MRVLFVNHTSVISGAEHSLLTLLRALPDHVSAAVAAPPGPFSDEVARMGMPTRRIQGTAGSLRLHPLHTTRAAAELARAALTLRRLARREGFEVVHANSIRAGLVAALAARLGGAPAVVHVRDCLPDSRTSLLVRRLIGWGAAVILSNSRYTQERFVLPGARAVSRVSYNPVDGERFDPTEVDREQVRSELGLDRDAVGLAVVAQLTPWKGQDDAVRIAKRLRDSGAPVRLLLVGSTKFVSEATRYDNPAFVRGLERLVDELQLREAVDLLGERADVPRVLGAADIVLAPSWEEPFGRSVAEAMTMGVPVAATSVGGPAELIDDGSDGLLLPPCSPDAWAQALEPLVRDAGLRERMGRAAREAAVERFSPRKHAEQVLAIYRDLLASRGRVPVYLAGSGPDST